MKELIINKNTNINNIKNKEEYEKLIINTKVYPFMLKDFKNIKELTIKRDRKGFNVYNEVHINKLPFKDKLEKLILFDVENFGRYKNINKGHYQLDLPNLKSIEIIGKLEWHNSNYFYRCKNLEEIMINTEHYFNKTFYFGKTTLEKVLLKNNYKEYEINLHYVPLKLEIKANDEIILKVNYEKNGVYSQVNDDLETKHTLNYYAEYMVDNGAVTIPDYITNINNYYNTLCYDSSEIASISFNLNLLKNQEERIDILGKCDLNYLDKIIIRNNNEMSLFPNTIINVKKYGNVENVYIENKKLYVIYNNLVIIIDETGKQSIKKIEIYKNTDEDEMEDYFKTYNVDDLENYFYYKKLLESLKDNKDVELNNAMNIVGDRIIKKLTRK